MKNRLPRSGTVIYHYLTSRQMTGSIDVHSNSHCGGKEETKENNHRRMDRVVPGFEPHLPVANSDSSERTRYAGAVFSSLETVGKEYHNQRRLAEKKHDFIARTVRDVSVSISFRKISSFVLRCFFGTDSVAFFCKFTGTTIAAQGDEFFRSQQGIPLL